MGDGALIRRWSDAGKLPHFGALTTSGSWIDVDSTAEVLHTSTWPTFATGMLPGDHGVYYPYQPRPGHQLARHISADQYGAATFWKLADIAHRRCVVYDVPETFPEADFGGRAIFDWGTWAWYGSPGSQPPQLVRHMKAQFGGYPLGYEAKHLALGHPRDLEQRLLRSVEYKSTTAQWLLGPGDWDLAVVGLCETHPAGHYLWPAAGDGGGGDSAFGPLLNIYTAVDRAVGALRAAVPPNTVMIVVSGDGVRPNYCGWHLLPAVLERLGYTATAAAMAGTVGEPSPPARGLVSLIPASARNLVTACLPWRVRDRLGVWLQTRRIDWSRTRAFTLPTDLEGCIRLNVKGREPHGIVNPGSEYTALCEEIRFHLEQLMNPATLAPAVRRVWTRNEVFTGARQEQLPDIIVSWNDDAPIAALQSADLGLVEGVNPDIRTGTHSTSGFLIANGAGIRSSYRGRGHLTDVASTVLRLLDVQPMVPLNGRPLDRLFEPANRPDSASAHQFS